MQKLIDGVAKFQQQGFMENEELFRTLANGQTPEALFITCADSRIDPNLITQTQPGDLFIIRNAGNIVPPHSMNTGGTTASIEYAVTALNVPHIVVCGHTDCGAMKGAMNPELLTSLPHVHTWLNHSNAAVAKVNALHGGCMNGDCMLELIEENVLLQLKHLETHPSVAAKLATGSVELHGWVYDIATGEVTCFDSARGKFIPIQDRYGELQDRNPRRQQQADTALQKVI